MRVLTAACVGARPGTWGNFAVGKYGGLLHKWPGYQEDPYDNRYRLIREEKRRIKVFCPPHRPRHPSRLAMSDGRCGRRVVGGRDGRVRVM